MGPVNVFSFIQLSNFRDAAHQLKKAEGVKAEAAEGAGDMGGFCPHRRINQGDFVFDSNRVKHFFCISMVHGRGRKSFGQRANRGKNRR